MDLSNVKDPASISALLDSLRSSAIFTFPGSSASTPPITSNETTAVQPTDVPGDTGPSAQEISSPTRPPASSSSAPTNTSSPPSSLSKHLSSLLSRLQPLVQRPLPTPGAESITALQGSPSNVVPNTSLRDASYKQSLSALAGLLEDPLVINTIVQLKNDQENLETSLWDGRTRIIEQQKKRVKDLHDRCRIINIAPTTREIEQLEKEFRHELRKYDKERVLIAWDSLTEKQQTTLEKLGVPTMYVTKDPKERARQQKIIDVIVNSIGN
ncbi:uncharacterized protein EI90DRAFT_2436607 [Cantharellus anzutake]|uniref:uncharacterized protein n=1 Tax=Cantharellus anzutake TaxID=1750568 RepID=UPI00190589A7|nr:uncharacterized protein EI90DRAFT_2436607 [Cantharellus anzutake]KAF8338987.1 hypothetical protein EI90DRAFT_2436607 [Cantharellus anzutake]